LHVLAECSAVMIVTGISLGLCGASEGGRRCFMPD
jgi:hypothetical protein